ncbi:MAG: AEC family transporter [Candidatus Marinarcus sp.]|uniref:AEC family transporter n=1 Tax=Candidatus Marinarcus sp. TaxID=3100987 RepID=UPI003B00E14A
MQNISTTLIPIFALISIGYFLKRVKFPSQEFWPMADRFTYYILFPALLIYKLSMANLTQVNSLNVVASGLLSILIMLFLTVAIGFFRTIERKAFTSIIQGAIRFNTYVFLALIDALLGDAGLVIAAVLIAFAIPFINFLCIGAFSYYINKDDLNFVKFAKSILTNPLIVACFVGGAINISGMVLPQAAVNTISILSAAALPLGLLSVGVGLELSHMSSAKFELFIATLLKLVIFPVLIFFVGSWCEVSKEALFVLVLFASMPTASSSYILARQLGGDLKLMSSIITVQTLVSMLTIGLVLSAINT